MKKTIISICVCLGGTLCSFATLPHNDKEPDKVHEVTVNVLQSDSGVHYEITSDDCEKCYVDKKYGILRCGKCNSYFDSGTKLSAGYNYTKYEFECLNERCRHKIVAKFCY